MADMTKKQIRSLWEGIQRRCKSEGDRQAKWPTYKGVSCEFKSFDEFVSWASECPGFGERDAKGSLFQIDKDILPNPKRVYSASTCCFVPPRLNSILNACSFSKGEWPIGVHWCGRDKAFYSKIRIDGARKHLGCFSDPMDAHKAWQIEKSLAIREALATYSALPGHDPRVISAMLIKVEQIDSAIARGDETL